MSPVSPNAYSGPPPPNLPRQDLLDGPIEYYYEIVVPLYEAAMKADWQAAKAIIDKYPNLELVRCSITTNGETTLHIATSANKNKKVEMFVQNLVGLMKKEDLALQNEGYNTALYMAAAVGNMKTVKIMLEKNKDLLTIRGSDGQFMPLYMAALYGYHDVVIYLYNKSNDLNDGGWTPQNRGELLERCVENNMFDVALRILEKHQGLANNGSILRALARNCDAFSETNSNTIMRTFSSACDIIGLNVEVSKKKSDALAILRIILNNLKTKPMDEVYSILKGPPHFSVPGNITYPSQVMFIAAQMGNTKFIVELIRLYPDLIWMVNDKGLSIFHIAVENRHEGIYNLLYEIGTMRNSITVLRDNEHNNILHLVGQPANRKRFQNAPGVALQMQQELLWFQEVESITPHYYRNQKNKDGLTPHGLFTEKHKALVKDGEIWMKEIAQQCMVVAALIATMVFTAAFTVPGGYAQGNDKNNGIPVFYSKAAFKVFVVADAISLFSSSASILHMFLSIFTSRYAEHDFLESLPKKLIVGLSYLFLSIITMIIAFSVSFFVLYHNSLLWMPILICIIAVIPLTQIIKLQCFLFFDVFNSTYGSRFKPKKQVLYYENPRV
ncbi:ankyrin repeat-containing domain, PGG domain protein [Tanacetum coccineum]